ncbi:TFIIH complex subunit [Maudiozyma humilis]|uniref:General transcription and DNA repair factor IIH subunit TFB5 n=1 Tax=Maudiozyma humilis TaxID=51915 RepID=A0AAV5RV96_MAUHU|nr:TFIIH complex subunit [Kazachstania humilis]
MVLPYTLQNTSSLEMARARRGMLLQCDPSIRALIVQIDAQHNDIILEELDDTHLLVDPSKVEFIKHELNRLLSKNIYNPMEEEEEQ